MAVTFLQLHNRLRAFLREEPLAAVASTDLLTSACTTLLNGAMRSVLDEHDWSFLVRDDGFVVFPQALSGITFVYNSAIPFFEIEELDANYLPLMQGDDCSYRLLVRGSAANPNHGNDSYRIITITATGANPGYHRLTLDDYQGKVGSFTGTANWLIYTHEAALPDTVGRVLSVRDENKLNLVVFAQQSTELDTIYPSALEATGNPAYVSIGGTVQNTVNAGQTGTRGLRLAIYPPYATSTALASLALIATQRLHYRYTYRFADLSAATDALTGVPNEIVELIVRRAFIDCLMGNVQNDPSRGQAMRAQLELDLRAAKSRDARDPLRRLVPRPFGSRRLGLHPNHRWATQQVPEP